MLNQMFFSIMLVNLLRNRLNRLRLMFASVDCFSTGVVNELKQLTNKIEIVERTITEEDVELFSKVTGDFNEIHSSGSGKRGIVHGALLNGIVSGVIGTRLPGNGTMVLNQTLNFPKPCYIGDTVIVTVEIENVRKIVTCKYQVINKLGKFVVLEGSAKLLLKKGYYNK